MEIKNRNTPNILNIKVFMQFLLNIVVYHIVVLWWKHHRCHKGRLEMKGLLEWKINNKNRPLFAPLFHHTLPPIDHRVTLCLY